MKKLIAIFPLVIFFLAQFGRVINFCCCSIATYEQTETFACDCEQQLFTAVKTDNREKNQTPANITAHQTADELFHFEVFYLQISIPAVGMASWPKTIDEQLNHISRASVFHPPLLLS